MVYRMVIIICTMQASKTQICEPEIISNHCRYKDVLCQNGLSYKIRVKQKSEYSRLQRISNKNIPNEEGECSSPSNYLLYRYS